GRRTVRTPRRRLVSRRPPFTDGTGAGRGWGAAAPGGVSAVACCAGRISVRRRPRQINARPRHPSAARDRPALPGLRTHPLGRGGYGRPTRTVARGPPGRERAPARRAVAAALRRDPLVGPRHPRAARISARAGARRRNTP